MQIFLLNEHLLSSLLMLWTSFVPTRTCISSYGRQERALSTNMCAIPLQHYSNSATSEWALESQPCLSLLPLSQPNISISTLSLSSQPPHAVVTELCPGLPGSTSLISCLQTWQAGLERGLQTRPDYSITTQQAKPEQGLWCCCVIAGCGLHHLRHFPLWSCSHAFITNHRKNCI